VLVGDGPLRPEMEILAGRLKVQDWVRFLGRREDVPDLLSACDLLVLPSLWEGMPNVLLEAGAAGRPVVATAVGGAPGSGRPRGPTLTCTPLLP